ncbi:MAG: hypothetical protein DHS20C18_29670 [Saprospiraceae bacterium]|nr:MAG: hypothetical protein DHS20C18_29670 [Saprospiraceae bacterium]
MPDQTPLPPLAAKIQFIAYHRPALSDGLYYLEVKPSLSTKGTQRITGGTQRKYFQISGTRFQLKPQEVHSVFPPNGSLGDHENVLPHIILNRSTLPWERYADGSSDNMPWLALLVFDGVEEIPPSEVISLKDLKTTAGEKRFPLITLEPGQTDTDQVTVIDVKRGLLDKIVPSKADLEYLAHVRQGFDVHDDKTGSEYAVVIANRLPSQEGISQVHLVAMEDRYVGNDFDYKTTNDQDTVRLVSLYSWQFACINPQKSLPRILEHLNSETTLSGDHNLRLPAVNNPLADGFLSTGFVPLRHLMRNGDKSVSWFHGPLATGINPNHADALPVMGSDALLRFDGNTGMFDVSYASAWELGRMLILQSKAVSVSLYNWKRSHAHENKTAELQLTHAHLPAQGLFDKTDTALAIPENVRKWFQNLSLLEGVPFSYLVPDTRMLPVESLRFFVVDNEWVECLLDGAFSVGRVVADDLQQDHGHHHDDAKLNPAENPFAFLSGFLMRSEAVAGYPDLKIDAYQTQSKFSLRQNSIAILKNADSTDEQIRVALVPDFPTEIPDDQLTLVTEIPQEKWLVHLTKEDEQYAIHRSGDNFQVLLKNKLLRREKLSENVLLCLFEGAIEEVDMYQNPETLHFGVDRPDPNINTYHKQLKNRQGGSLDNVNVAPLPYKKNDAEMRVLDIADLATQKIKTQLSWNRIDSALFAIEMTEGVERIRFKAGN